MHSEDLTDRRSPASPPGGAPEPSSANPGVAARRERLQADLLAAAEEEAAAIVEEARREITVTVRRARRDLLLIRAQLQLIGLEPRQIADAGLETASLEDVTPTPSLHDEASPDTWPQEVPRDAILVNRTHALRHAVAEAATELDDLPAPVPEVREREESTVTATPVVGVSGSPPLFSAAATPWLIAAVVIVLAIAGGLIGWRYGGRSPRSIPPQETVASTAGPDASANANAGAQAERLTSAAAQPASVGNRSVPPSRVVLQTTRPVWMRVDVDGNRDGGHLHPADETTELNPSRSVTVRVGDAGAVLLSVDGAPPKVLGAPGEVLTRQIAIPNAAKPAASVPVAEKPVTPVPPVTSPAPAPGRAASVPPTAPAGRGAPVASISPPGRGATVPSPPSAARATAPAAGAVTRPGATPGTPTTDQRTQGSTPPQPLDAEQQAAIFARHVQWLDAYGRSDQSAMSTLTATGFSLRDERIGRSANAAASTGTPMQVSDVHIDVAGVGAVLTARLRTTVDGVTTESMLSEVWVRGEQQRWSLMGVRITPVESVPQPAR